MAGIAKQGLRLDQQDFGDVAVMNGMAGGAAHVIEKVRRAEKIRVVAPVFMAA